MSKHLKCQPQWLYRLEACQDDESKEGQVHSIYSFGENEWNCQDEQTPQRQVHQEIVQCLLQTGDKSHALLYLAQSLLKLCQCLLTHATSQQTAKEWYAKSRHYQEGHGNPCQ